MRVRDKILVIDDERSIRNLITTLLNANGYYPLAAENGAEARSLLYSHCPDAVILDLGLPDMDGVEILKKIREWSTIPVIVVSARTMERDKVLAFDLGADDYLEKPFGVNELLARVRTALRHTRISKDNKDIARLGKAVIGGLTIDYDNETPRRPSRKRGGAALGLEAVETLGICPCGSCRTCPILLPIHRG